MEHKEGIFRGQRNLNLYYQCWLQGGKPKAILLVVNGLAEHSGRYQNLVDYFVPRGYAVYSYDHPGHGRSEGARCYVERFSEYIDDLKSFFNIVCDKHNDAKVFLIGHSMGGTIATMYAIRYQQDLAGLLLSAATLKVGSTAPSALLALAGILSALLPKMGTIILDAPAISRDKTVVDAYINDPLVYCGKIPARTGAELVKTIQELPPKMPAIRLPILIMQGTADRLSAPEGSKMLYEQVSSKDKTLKLYEGCYHEIFNEPQRQQVFADMEAWLASHI